MRTIKTLLVLALAFMSYQVNAQFKDSSWLISVTAEGLYNQRKDREELPPPQYSPASPFAYSDGKNYFIGGYFQAMRLKNKKANTIGLYVNTAQRAGFLKEGQASSYDFLAPVTNFDVGILLGRMYFVNIPNSKFYWLPSIQFKAAFGTEKFKYIRGPVTGGGFDNTPYDLNTFYMGVNLKPFVIGYKVSKKSMLEFNFLNINSNYIRKTGNRVNAPSGNRITKTNIEFANNFDPVISVGLIQSITK